MGQNPSCFSTGTDMESMRKVSRENKNGAHSSHNGHHTNPVQLQHTMPSTLRANNMTKSPSNYPIGTTRTSTAGSVIDDNHEATEKNRGYVLVDLKGDKMVHVDQLYLVGCEIYAPGLGIGLIVSCMTETKYTIHYKVQMADGRNIVVSIRKCDTFQLAARTNLNPRIFVMQRLY